MIVRRSFQELVNNHINFLIPELNGIARYNKTDKVFTFFNGSILKMEYCANDGDLAHIQGSEWDIIFLEEATNFTEFQIRAITACLRGTNGFPKRIYYTMNPGGPGHQYIKRLFIDKRYEANEIPEEYTFIQSLVTDNYKLMETMPDYVQQLEALPPHLRKMWLEGDWNVAEGMVFEEFADRPEHYKDRQWTHVIEPFDIPKEWTVFRSFDWGYHHPFSCGYWAQDFDGVVYRILEFYGCTKQPNEGLKWHPQKVFTELKKFENEHPWLKERNIQGVADPAIWNAEYGESIAETAAKCGIYFQKGDHERLAGLMQVHYRMAFDENGFPMMYVFSNCKGFIRTMPLLMYDEHKPEDVDTDGEDHIFDETKYFLMSRPIKPRVAAPADPYYSNPMYVALGIPKEDVMKKPLRKRMEVIDNG